MPLISTLVSICFGIPRLTDTIKNKLYETSDCWSRDMFNFDFKKGSGSSFSTTFSVWFSRKIFFILHSINYTNFIVWLPLLHWDISKNVCCNFRYQFCDVINFEIYLSFLTKPFSSMSKSSEQKLKYLKKERTFSGEMKTIFRLFKGRSDMRVYL